LSDILSNLVSLLSLAVEVYFMLWIILIIGIILFVISIIADDISVLAISVFVVSPILWWMVTTSIFPDFYIPPSEKANLNLIEFYKWSIKQSYCSLSILIASLYFCFAAVVGVMGFVVKILENYTELITNLESGELFVYSGSGILIGLVFVVGFKLFFEGTALVLGIVATSIGIIVGIKSLTSYDKNKTRYDS
jgi:hypothetical protein